MVNHQLDQVLNLVAVLSEQAWKTDAVEPHYFMYNHVSYSHYKATAIHKHSSARQYPVMKPNTRYVIYPLLNAPSLSLHIYISMSTYKYIFVWYNINTYIQHLLCTWQLLLLLYPSTCTERSCLPACLLPFLQYQSPADIHIQ